VYVCCPIMDYYNIYKETVHVISSSSRYLGRAYHIFQAEVQTGRHYSIINNQHDYAHKKAGSG
jgi:hypothetical protein